MRKITLDFGGPASAAAFTRREIHEYIAEKMDFPEYYGHNLDALYDCLTDIAEPTAVGIAIPVILENLQETARQMALPAGGEDDGHGPQRVLRQGQEHFDAMKYFRKVRKAFADAEADNPNLAVFDLTALPEDPEEEE